ncbi:MAG: YbaB/EbfC family nucleoid-associated protein, partial [Caulobacterales bacterium]|nr:YbaB/EbfC family nucleoid-associated protein [Caulobacterales bacterium]
MMRDLMGMMSKIKELQDKLQEVQAEIAAMEISGSAGGGLVTVTMDGTGGLKSVKIDPALIKEDEIEILEDLIVAAAGDARAKA